MPQGKRKKQIAIELNYSHKDIDMRNNDSTAQHSDCDSCKSLQRLCDEHARQIARAVVVAAHPDDEVIGLGSLLPRLRRATFIHTTDGSPRDMEDAARAGFSSRAAYRIQRAGELKCAFACAGIIKPKTKSLGFTDKEASLNLISLTRALAQEFARLRPAIVFTHAYEGGHPDHDATAFAVRYALHIHRAETLRHPAPLHVEYASYHEHENGFRCGAFLPYAGAVKEDELGLTLSPTARNFKRNLFRCFASQAEVLARFDTGAERFRCAPVYDFTEAPHAGRLHYETFGWGWTGARWRTLARLALAELSEKPNLRLNS